MEGWSMISNITLWCLDHWGVMWVRNIFVCFCWQWVACNYYYVPRLPSTSLHGSLVLARSCFIISRSGNANEMPGNFTRCQPTFEWSPIGHRPLLIISPPWPHPAPISSAYPDSLFSLPVDENYQCIRLPVFTTSSSMRAIGTAQESAPRENSSRIIDLSLLNHTFTHSSFISARHESG